LKKTSLSLRVAYIGVILANTLYIVGKARTDVCCTSVPPITNVKCTFFRQAPLVAYADTLLVVTALSCSLYYTQWCNAQE
jgi:hypothetical protein